jgi:Ser/Thr protein kinase RdoA (MazF antagonist)
MPAKRSGTAIRASSPGPCGEDRPLDVIYSTLSPAVVQKEAREVYDIGGAESCHLLQSGINDTYLLKTHRDRYVMRVYRSLRSPSDIQYELQLLAHLDARGVSVSVAILGRDGGTMRSLPAPEGTRRCVLFTYAPGRPMSWEREEHRYLAGRAAASMHDASADFVSSQHRRSFDLEYLLDRSLALVEPFLAHRPEDQRYLEGLVDRVRCRIADAASGLDWGPCHGDFGVGNLHVADATVTLFDFDFCGPGWRLYDLVGPWRISRADRDRLLWMAFQRGYAEKRSLTAHELAILPFLDVAERIHKLGLRAERAPLVGIRWMGDDYLDRELSRLHRWDDVHFGGE